MTWLGKVVKWRYIQHSLGHMAEAGLEYYYDVHTYIPLLGTKGPSLYVALLCASDVVPLQLIWLEGYMIT